MEIAIVAIIVAVAVALLALRALRQLRQPRRACGCGAEQDCASCAVVPTRGEQR